jgi:hypothetical protein
MGVGCELVCLWGVGLWVLVWGVRCGCGCMCGEGGCGVCGGGAFAVHVLL